LVWLALCCVLFIQVTGRTFVLPATTILVNNASPHPSVLGTMHGIGQSLASAGRALGPSLGGTFYGMGLRHGVVGAAWWGISGWAILTCIASNWVREGDGHEVKLEGDDEAEAEWQADDLRRRELRG
jgi:MFS family permease